MADYKRIVKNVLFVALVPTVIVAGYYGYKAFKNYSDKNKEGEQDENEESEKDNEDKSNITSSEEENTRETKVIPITRGIEVKPTEEEKEQTKNIKEA